MQKPTIALVDWNWMGHHPTYFKSLLAGFLEAGCRVAAFCPKEGHAEISRITEDNEFASVSICRYVHPKKRLPRVIRSRENAWRIFGVLEKSLRAWEARHGHKIDLVFFSTIHDFQFDNFHLAKRWFKRPWSGIYLHARAFRMPGSPMPYFNQLPCPEKIFHHPSLSSVCLIDEGAVEFMKALTNGKPAFEFPDMTGTDIEPPSENTITGKLLHFANGRKIVVSLGYLQKSKGLIELCQAAQDPRCADVCFFFAGEVNWGDFSTDEAAGVRSTWEKQPNVLTHLTRISDATMNALVQASDIVFAAYTDFPNSSNMMSKAALVHRPLIVSDGYLMAERVRKYRLGTIVPEGSVPDIVAQIRHLCEHGGQPDADYNGYFANHSTEALNAALAKVIAAIPNR